ncbi:MAG: glutamate-1-semialdehyde 2,1-aminomutase [Chloroflexi bacterium]|nr:glutamate-1-semialdehyde 2,1-aminomutase [Chloroflexota bacterium]
MSNSQAIYERATQYIPGGVSSSNRLIQPNLVFTHAAGAYIWDADGKRYIDYHAAFGPPVLGHCHPEVNRRVAEAMSQIDLVGIGANEMEIELAEKICHYVPSAQRVMFTNSGSEATYYALRFARAATGRRKIIKFQGCYHGWHDAVAMNIISAPNRVGQKDPISAGMTPEVVDDTLVLPFNDIEELHDTIQQHGDGIAAVILEPIPHNIGAVLPRPEFLRALRDLTLQKGIVLIFDEVITGWRHGLGGYQKIAGITPDLTTMGKAIANGFPLAALCGRADIMDRGRPGGDVFVAGTYNAHPMSVAAALATIEILERPETYPHLFGLGDRMRAGLNDIIARLGIEATIAGFGSVFVTYFMKPPVDNYTDLLRNDAAKFVAYRKALIERGIYKLPVNLKRNHISLAHTLADVDETLEKAEAAMRTVLQ